MNRSQRRAAERFARSQSQKTAAVSPDTNTPAAAPAPAVKQVSDAQLAANRANAQHSTGPKSETGRTAIRHNALKSGLTGQTVLLPNDDVEAYEKLFRHMINQYKPVGCEEEGLVQSLIDSNWRLRRIPGLEAGIYAIGRNEFSKDESIPTNLIDSHVYLKYERQLRNLCVQESRLSRKLEKDTNQLRNLQASRLMAEQHAAKAKAAAQEEDEYETNTEPENGFEFSNDEIEPHSAVRAAAGN